MLKVLRDWNDLRPYGINCLTGEACNLSARLLCDLTDEGRSLICEILGLPYNTEFCGAWNGGEGHIWRAMLPYHLFPVIAVFALLKSGATVAIHTETNGVMGLDEEHLSRYKIDLDGEDPYKVVKECFGIVRTYRPFNAHPHRGFSNVHAMTGCSA